MTQYSPHFLFLFQLIAHMALIYALFTFSALNWITVLLVYFITGCVGMSMTYHRLLSHSSYKTGKLFEVIGTLCAAYGLTGSSIAWVNNHRAHHRYTDTRLDPHAPSFLGYIIVQWFSMFTSTKSLRYINHLRKDKFHIFVHRYYFIGHLAILLGMLTFFGLHITCVFYLVPAAILWNAGSFINTVCHSGLGYRNHNTKDKSVNNSILGILMWGEGYHNNHHANPNSPRFGNKWWEFDISWQLIKVIRKNVSSA